MLANHLVTSKKDHRKRLTIANEVGDKEEEKSTYSNFGNA